ncbi:unnamed protein product (macronuclear) [Paramecium tetraurelia]|uniref:RecQ mediated genome instability protein 1 N-terminal domain-containing protein n=1 Tax=Paramecium tetraurelia TaxID=5888 RepID=A0BVV0_PARTE|nr:uncharacterized protein GSPATT00032519001 [Paramecium tetraurelia]CAK62667.1 unnamed protein product [Paramecium tetraurelia]|eukprot:XP_001430065.1 hypothetical protein (macronuclear) [Paramecium tetraurelia strain d4-2]
MKQVVASNEYYTMKKVQMLHSHAQTKDSSLTLGRTTSYESSQFCRNLDMMIYRRASTKEEVNNSAISKHLQNQDEKLAISNINWIKQLPIQNRSPSLYIEMNELQTKVWRALRKQQLQSVYSVEIIVLKNQSEFEFTFDISHLSCFLRVRELGILINETCADRVKLKSPYLSILIGRVKTQKLDGNMKLFELAHILINGQRTLILQES